MRATSLEVILCLPITFQNVLKKNKTEFLNALGPGRGFCARGGIFNITYSPIQGSQVIESAEKKSKEALHTVVLFTDIGNDLMYGVSADTLIAS